MMIIIQRPAATIAHHHYHHHYYVFAEEMRATHNIRQIWPMRWALRYSPIDGCETLNMSQIVII